VNYGDISITLMGQHAAVLSAKESALLAETLWQIGTTTKTPGAIAVSAALMSAANTSLLGTQVNVRRADVPAMQQALDELPSGPSGLANLDAAMYVEPA
jgi:hypothetical protein